MTSVSNHTRRLPQLQKELESIDEGLKRLDHISEDGILQRRQLLKVLPGPKFC